MALPIKFNSKVSSQLKDKELADKIKSAKKTKPKSNNILDILEKIRQDVDKNLGKFRDKYQVITDKEKLREYIHKANAHGYIAIDTETLGLNPMVDGIVGLCLYFPGEPATYVPINHVNYFSDIRLENQLTEADIKECLQELTAKVIYHNAQFDIRVLKHQVGIIINAYWDTLVAAKLYDENEAHNLKILHSKYISNDDEKTFGELFGKIAFKYVPIEYAYLYAAHDAIDTYELYEFQKKYFDNEPELTWLLFNIEMPMVEVIVDLEDNGVAIDREYLDKLHKKYNGKVSDALDVCITEIEKYFNDIKKYNAQNPNKQFRLPPNISSSQQLAILFYDIIKCKPVPGKKARSTDGDVLGIWAKDHPVAKAIIDYRAAQKIVSTYVNNIPDIIHTDGRVHTHFLSMGAKTGRMSSADPINLQNIPSKNEDLRKMFVGQTTIRDVDKRSDNSYILDRCEEVQLENGDWVWAESVKVGDVLESGEVVKAVKVKEFRVLIGV